MAREHDEADGATVGLSVGTPVGNVGAREVDSDVGGRTVGDSVRPVVGAVVVGTC